MKTEQTSNVSVEEAANDRYNSMLNFYCHDSREYLYINGATFGANWQKEQDKAIILELVGYIKSLKIHFHGWSKLDEQTMGYKAAKEGLELISKAEQYINQ